MFGIDDMALALGASAVIGAGVSVYNNWQQKKENATMRAREDNAISRRIADLQANGLSATLAAGSPAASSAATAPRYESSAFDRMSQALSLYQGKADISHTNSQTALNEMMSTSEKFKQAFLQAQTEGENLRNNWINADMFSKLDLRDKEGQKIGEEMKRIIQDTALLKAQTAYEQANTDFIKTQNDNALINQDMLINNRQWNDYLNASKVWQQYTGNKANLLSVLGGIAGASSMLEKQFPNLSFNKSYKNWYMPKRFVP